MRATSWLPECCRNCSWLDSDFNEYTEETVYFCRLDIWWPTKKQSCKKQKPWRKAVSALMPILLLMAAPCCADQQGQVQTLEGHDVKPEFVSPTTITLPDIGEQIEWVIVPKLSDEDVTINSAEIEEALALALKWLEPPYVFNVEERANDIRKVKDVYQRLKTINEAQKGK